MKLTPHTLEPEEWRDVPSHPLMMASSWGRVVKKPTPGRTRGSSIRDYKSQPTFGVTNRAKKTAKHSFKQVAYRKLGNLKVHRLVCEAFHGLSPFPGAVVIHINEDSHDNRPSNLKWGTQKENLNAPGFLTYCRARKGENSPTVKGRIWRAE